MKLFILIPILLLTQHLLAQQPDSTGIKLQLYKSYLDKGLINQQDYDLLKEKLLRLTKIESKPMRPSAEADTGIKQYNKKTTFEIRIEPVAFFDVRDIYVGPYFNTNGQLEYNKQVLPNEQSGGIHIGIGAAFKKRYHVHVMMGFDGNQQQQIFTAGADFNVNILPGRFSPFVHLGAGYASLGGGAESEDLPYQTAPALNGFYTCSGVGLYMRLAKFFALNISPEYRFMYAAYSQVFNDYNTGGDAKGTCKVSYQQLGLRIAMVFY